MSNRAFIKMHGLGNDFVVVDAREVPFALSDASARALADRRTGVGCDQIVVLEAPRNGILPALIGALGAAVALNILARLQQCLLKDRFSTISYADRAGC